jgi:hypothetical protein
MVVDDEHGDGLGHSHAEDFSRKHGGWQQHVSHGISRNPVCRGIFPHI